jgi:hypothetical protein
LVSKWLPTKRKDFTVTLSPGVVLISGAGFGLGSGVARGSEN